MYEQDIVFSVELHLGLIPWPLTLNPYPQTWKKLKSFHRQIFGGSKFPQKSVIRDHLKIIIFVTTRTTTKRNTTSKL